MLQRLRNHLKRRELARVQRVLEAMAAQAPASVPPPLADAMAALVPVAAHVVRTHAPRNNEDWRQFAIAMVQQQSSPEQLRSWWVDALRSQLPPSLWPLLPVQRREAPVMSTWTYQNEVQQWDIAPDEMVLDVGSGGWPFRRADHLADKYPEQTTHRTEAIARDARPFHQVDLQALPFADKAYDFVFCSHVLEHLDDPGRAIRELSRVGRRGYIEVPTRVSDVMFNFTRLPQHHRWHGLVLGRTLVLMEWCDWERRELGNEFFDALQSEYDNAFQQFFERNRDLFFASLHWQGAIGFIVLDKHGQVIDSSNPTDAR
jgi:SAM-dependent methyltransferase